MELRINDIRSTGRIEESKPTAPPEEGDLVWAKLDGYSYWPSVVMKPDEEPVPCYAGFTKINFLGYEDDVSLRMSNFPTAANGTTHLNNVSNCLNTNIYSYFEISGGQSSNLHLNVVHFFQHKC